MPTQAEISRDWKTSRQYVSLCVKEGCPLTSFEDARNWRKAHKTKRPTTSAVQIARLLAQESDDDSPEARGRRKEYFANKPEGTKLPPKVALEVALYNAEQAATESWRLLSEAMIEGADSKIGSRLSVHSKALEAYFKAEEAYRTALERQRILIPLSIAQDMARKGFDIILTRLAALPQNLSTRANPTDPLRAMEVLQDECVTIIQDAQKAFAA